MTGMYSALRIVGLLLVAMLLAACGAPASAPAPTSPPAAAGQTATQAAPAQPAATSAAGAAASSGNFDGSLTFGAPISLTGSTAKEGGLTRDGYELWKDTYNKAGGINVGGKHYKIETKYYDDASNAQQSATLAEKLIK